MINNRRRVRAGARPSRRRRTKRSTACCRERNASSRDIRLLIVISKPSMLTSTGVAEHPVVTTVRAWVETEVRHIAPELDHADRYPYALVERMQEMGLFGALVPVTYGGLGLDVSTYAKLIEEICRGWMSLAGVLNSHTMAALIVLRHGTEEQRGRFLPPFARGDARGGLCLTEPHAGSEVQAIRTRATRRGDH